MIGAFARSVGSTAAEYFDPIIASFDGYHDVVAPAVFAVVPGQAQQNALLYGSSQVNEVALTGIGTGPMPLLHGIHLELDRPIVAGMHLTAATEVTQKRISGPISALTTVTTINDGDTNRLATVTQKLALVSNRNNSAAPVSGQLDSTFLSNGGTREHNVAGDIGTFEMQLSQKELKDYVTVSGDTNPIHTSASYAAEFGYSAPLAQGMLMLGRALSHLEFEIGHYLTPKQIQARFISPVQVPDGGTTVIVHTLQKNNQYHLDFHHQNHRVARATVTA